MKIIYIALTLVAMFITLATITYNNTIYHLNEPDSESGSNLNLEIYQLMQE